MKPPIPEAALDDRLFFTGTAGTGKTYNAMGRVERLLKRKHRVVIPDPLGVWWGLRLDKSGKQASDFDVVIFGGPHGDLPLTEHAGALIGETVSGMRESCILDLSELGTKAAERRFMLAFLTALYKHASGEPVHVVFDESDMWSPQRVLDKEGEANKLLGMMETIVRRGRVKGFIPWLISQRPAVISKDVLSQVDGLIAFKLTSSQDRDAIGDWVQGQADKQQWKDIWAQLPTMERGQGVVWLPARGILDTVQFPEKETFDSSRTPKRGEKAQRAAELKPLDVAKVKDRLAVVEAEAKANDPRALRADIAKLKAERDTLQEQVAAAASKAPAAAKPDKDALKAAEEKGFEQAKKKLTAAMEREGRAKVLSALEGIRDVFAPIGQALEAAIKDAKSFKPDLSDVSFTVSPPPAPPPGRSGARPPTAVVREPRPRAAAPTLVRQAAGDGSYTRPQMRVLESLAMWKALGHESPSREMVAAVAGYSPSSGGYNNLLGSLATVGAIGKPMPGHLSLQVDGIGVMSREDGVRMLMTALKNPQRKLVAALHGREALSREQLGEATGYSASSGGFNNLIGSLSTLGIIVKPQQGYVALSDWAQELLNGYGERIAA